jgi:hypothetical protein
MSHGRCSGIIHHLPQFRQAAALDGCEKVVTFPGQPGRRAR